MAVVILTFKIMPASPEVDLDKLAVKVEELIRGFVDEKHKDSEIRKEEEPIGFGLKALNFIFVMDESKGATDDLEKQISDEEAVKSVQVTDVRRAIG